MMPSRLHWLKTSNEISNRLKELGVLLSHEPMAALLEDLLFGLRYAFEDLIGRKRRRDLVVASGEDESRSDNFGKPGSDVVGRPRLREKPVQHVDVGNRLEA